MRHRMMFCSLAIGLLSLVLIKQAFAESSQFYRINDKILQVTSPQSELSETVRINAASAFINSRWVCDVDVEMQRMKIKLLDGQVVVENTPICNVSKTIPVEIIDIDAPPELVDPPFVSCDTIFDGNPAILEMKIAMGFLKQNGKFISKNFFHYFNLKDPNDNQLLSTDSQSNSIVPFGWLSEMQKSASLNTGMDGYIDTDGGMVLADLFDADVYYTIRLAFDVPVRP